MYIGLHVKYRYSCPILMKIGFSQQIFRKITNFTKIRPVGAELCHADRKIDGRTDATKLIVAFRNFTNTPEKINPPYSQHQYQNSLKQDVMCRCTFSYTWGLFEYARCLQQLHSDFWFTLVLDCLSDQWLSCLTFRNLASYIQDWRKITLQMPHFIQKISVLNILNMLYNLHFFSLQNAVYFKMLPCLVSVLLTF